MLGIECGGTDFEVPSLGAPVHASPGLWVGAPSVPVVSGQRQEWLQQTVLRHHAEL